MRLKALDDHLARGHQFEGFIGQLFGRSHFEVTRNPGTGGMHQVDLLATMSDETYLVEIKWWARRVGLREMEDLESRLKKASPKVIGLFISYLG